MVYFNADGRPSCMCGNGGRCLVAFAKQLGIIENRAHFLAVDGPHEARVEADGTVRLRMIDVAPAQQGVQGARYFCTPARPTTSASWMRRNIPLWLSSTCTARATTFATTRPTTRPAPALTSCEVPTDLAQPWPVRTYERG
ncbi:MAG: hypothetical protein WKG07_07455 [Hymenobacter sp.]